MPAPAGTPRPGPIRWLRAELRDSWLETRTARTLVFSVPGWAGHDPGQHVDIKLTAEDGYTAQRSYSIASASEPGRLELTIQAVSNGEVSPYLVETMEKGDQLELRGPIGGWFRWSDQLTERVLLIGGGSGIVPLMAMLRQRIRSESNAPFHMMYVARTPDHLFYANELYEIGESPQDIIVDCIYTREGLVDGLRSPGRLRIEDLPPPVTSETTNPLSPALKADQTDRHQGSRLIEYTRVYVCGPSGFVENAAQLLQERGHQAHAIRTERFGPTGG